MGNTRKTENFTYRNLIRIWSQESIVLLSTHIVSDLEACADEILMMKAGRLLHADRIDKSISKADGITSLEELYLYYFK